MPTDISAISRALTRPGAVVFAMLFLFDSMARSLLSGVLPVVGLDHGVGHSLCRGAQTPLVLMRVEDNVEIISLGHANGSRPQTNVPIERHLCQLFLPPLIVTAVDWA